MTVQRKLLIAGLFLGVLLIVGTGGYMAIEGWGVLDALYQTVITLSTVGFSEVEPMSASGRIFTMFLIVGGVGGAAYTLSSTVQLAIEGQFNEYFGRRRMVHTIAGMNGHYIVCGFGRVGQEIARELHDHAVPFIVVEHDPTLEPLLREAGYPCVYGEATRPDVLRQAGAERATTLLAASDRDTDNTYIVLMARAINPRLFTVSRATRPDAELPLQHAGADRVISPYNVAGRQMASAALYPAITDIMNIGVTTPDGDMVVAHLNVTHDSGLAGQSVAEMQRSLQFAEVIGLTRGNQYVARPAQDMEIAVDDQLFVVAVAANVHAFGQSLRNTRAHQETA
jgi:voltage-gated potassium channel